MTDTDTDKLKRLAEELIADDDCPMLVPPQTIRALIAENEAKDAEIERLRDALTFYASDKRWDDLANEVRWAELALDEGDKARQALTRKDGE